MCTRLRCRDCAYHATYYRHRTAHRAAISHHCTPAATIDLTPTWWSRLFGATATVVGHAPDPDGTGTTARRLGFTDDAGNLIEPAWLAAYHTDTTRRARAAMADIVRAGYQLGPPPYGYNALRVRVTSPDGHSKLRAVLVPNHSTAPVVRQIYQWRADPDRPSFTEIACRLNHDPQRYPPPTPNGRWSAGALRRLVANPKYTGRQVWARTTHRTAVAVTGWITSAPLVHEPLVDDCTWRHAQPTTSGGDRHAA